MENQLKTLKYQILQKRIPLLRGVRGVLFTPRIDYKFDPI